jgi:hypothetical protein
MRAPNVFRDPATGVTYNWAVNHTEESSIAKSRQMADGGATDNIGLVPQQGAATPLILTWKGTFFDPEQLTEFLHFWELCEDHSIYLTDFAGDLYEVLITDFSPQRVAANRNPKFPDLTWVWTYDITMRVLTAFSGPWVGVSP